MRDTGDMMEDAFSEDTMMECSGDDASLDDLVDLTDEISHTVPTIRDAAERLLTLLGVDSNENDDNTSSEDEGVDLDDDSDENEDDDEDEQTPQSTRLLHELASSLAQELKYTQKQGNKTSTRLVTTLQRGKKNHETSRVNDNEQIQCMEVGQDNVDETKNSKYHHNEIEQTLPYKTSHGRDYFVPTSRETCNSMKNEKYRASTNTRMTSNARENDKTVLSTDSTADSWAIGWDACAAEAIRYLIEDEGLSPHHPTVLAMKSHLEIQRERALAQYAV